METNKDKYNTKQLLDLIVRTGTEGYEMLLESASVSKLSETLTKKMMSELDTEDEELVLRYRYLLECQSVGNLLSTILSQTPDYRAYLLTLTDNSPLQSALILLFSEWDRLSDFSVLERCFYGTYAAFAENDVKRGHKPLC